ncbi:hypothetical protein JXA88_12655 [Candidatus Fermentibacteria bacterium]|nr:hypothetical protein [Candidatus Fermentibacteria bacterium]
MRRDHGYRLLGSTTGLLLVMGVGLVAAQISPVNGARRSHDTDATAITGDDAPVHADNESPINAVSHRMPVEESVRLVPIEGNLPHSGSGLSHDEPRDRVWPALLRAPALLTDEIRVS